MKYYKGLNGRIYSESNIQDAYYIILGRAYDPKIDKVTDLLGIEKEIEPTVEDFVRNNQMARAAFLYQQQERAAGNNPSVQEAKAAVERIRAEIGNVEFVDAGTAIERMKAVMNR